MEHQGQEMTSSWTLPSSIQGNGEVETWAAGAGQGLLQITALSPSGGPSALSLM